MHLHFCMDKYVGWDFLQNENTTCNKCGMKESSVKKGCCKDELKQLKINTDHQKSTTASFINIFQTPIIRSYPSLLQFISLAFYVNSTEINYSPQLLPLTQKRTVLYCTYRI